MTKTERLKELRAQLIAAQRTAHSLRNMGARAGARRWAAKAQEIARKIIKEQK